MKVKSLFTSLLLLTSSQAHAINNLSDFTYDVPYSKFANDVAERLEVSTSDLYLAKNLSDKDGGYTSAASALNIKDGAMSIAYLTDSECNGLVGLEEVYIHNKPYSMHTICLEYPSGERIKFAKFNHKVDNDDIVAYFNNGNTLHDESNNIYWSLGMPYMQKPVTAPTNPNSNNNGFLVGLLVAALILSYWIFLSLMQMKSKSAGKASEESEGFKRKNVLLLEENEGLKRSIDALISENNSLKSNHHGSSDLLDKANATIRNANSRINELKNTLNEKDGILRQAYRIERELREELKNGKGSTSFSDTELLGVSDRTDKVAIKKNYKTLSIVYHPDRTGTDAMMKHINAARDRLLK